LKDDNTIFNTGKIRGSRDITGKLNKGAANNRPFFMRVNKCKGLNALFYCLSFNGV
jgi:hypothetical protein